MQKTLLLKCRMAFGFTVASMSMTVVAQTDHGENEQVAGDVRGAIRAAAREGKLLYRLTEPGDVRKLFGPPDTVHKNERDGDMRIRRLHYGNTMLVFGCIGSDEGPFSLVYAGVGEDGIDIGRDRKIVLRTEHDLKKLDSFQGFGNISLAAIDLKAHGELVANMPFDTRTEWPPAEKLPSGFEPARMLELGKDPGLGVRALHEQGVDGKGVHVAIIDQPLLLDHEEYISRIERYEALGVRDVPPQMHGPPVTSILVGRNCGVAPGAILTYFAVPMWVKDNAHYCDALETIMRRNERVSPGERIRVVSISTGMFPQQKNYDRWKVVLKRAHESGILVVTCDQGRLRYGRMKRKMLADPDAPESYQRGKYGGGNDRLLVPTGGRTTACTSGPEDYEYWPDGGLSWATPYLAGLAALAFQENPEISPEEIMRLWVDTSQPCGGVQMINPPAFIEAVRALP